MSRRHGSLSLPALVKPIHTIFDAGKAASMGCGKPSACRRRLRGEAQIPYPGFCDSGCRRGKGRSLAACELKPLCDKGFCPLTPTSPRIYIEFADANSVFSILGLKLALAGNYIDQDSRRRLGVSRAFLLLALSLRPASFSGGIGLVAFGSDRS